MAWAELEGARVPGGKTWADGSKRLAEYVTGMSLHYPGAGPDSEVYDTEVDCSPVRVDNAQLDGWRVTQAGWHYALGKPGNKPTDGWVGFGGREGQHWFKFRLLRVGYLHWPTRGWDDIGGAPNYDRANLSQQTGTLTLGPEGSEISINVESVAKWEHLWQTPGGGDLSAQWQANGDRLKEKIIVNQAAREWVRDNRPPGTPIDETYFGFVFKLDWSNIPKVLRNGVLQDIDGDFADDEHSIELRDALDRLLAFLPVGTVKVPQIKPVPGQPLRRRFWKDADGNHYLLIGVRCDVLAGMEPGDLIFDPTVDKTVNAGGDDGYRYTGTDGFSSVETYGMIGYENDPGYYHCHAFFRWTGVTIAGTIETSYIDIYDANTWGQDQNDRKVWGVDEDNPAAPTSAAEFDADTLTTAGVDWDGDWAVSQYNRSPSLNTVFQELVDSYTISNDAVMVQVKNDGGAVTGYCYPDYYENSPSNPAKLHIEYTAGTTYYESHGGGLTPAGTLVGRAEKAMAGALSLAGVITRGVLTSKAGTLTSAGTVAKKTTKSMGGVLGLAGSISKQIAKVLAGVVSFVGVLKRYGERGTERVWTLRVENRTATLVDEGRSWEIDLEDRSMTAEGK